MIMDLLLEGPTHSQRTLLKQEQLRWEITELAIVEVINNSVSGSSGH
jgi:hypothetical protein